MAEAVPVCGAGSAKRYSTRAPSWLTDHGRLCCLIVLPTFAANVDKTIREYELPWSVNQLGARVEYRFTSPAPTTGTASAQSADPELEDFLHVYLANRGILLTPFHNMALMSPSTTQEQVAHHDAIFQRAVGELLSARTDPS